MKKAIIYVTIILLLFTGCVNNKKTQTKEEQPVKVEEPVYEADLSMPVPETTEEEKRWGIFYDDFMEGGWQLLGNDGQPTAFNRTDALLFVVYCPPERLRKLGIKANPDEVKYFAVLYYRGENTNNWTMEYNYGTRRGSLITIKAGEKGTKGQSYKIKHVVGSDGRRYLEVTEHPSFNAQGRLFVKSLP